jgi:polyisoprenyl-teichoic acid--peptidoglycan teichoic acid transferase
MAVCYWQRLFFEVAMPRPFRVGSMVLAVAMVIVIVALTLPRQDSVSPATIDPVLASDGSSGDSRRSPPQTGEADQLLPRVTTDAPPESNQASRATETENPKPGFSVSLPALPSVGSLLPGKQPLTVLLLGLDQAQGGISRADSIMIVRIDSREPGANVLSIPRDLYLPLYGGGADRINAAYAFGAAAGGPEVGANRLIQTLRSNLDLEVDGYVLVDFECFKRVIDAVGGVTVDVPRQVRTDQFRDETGEVREVTFPEGPNHLDGVRALEFARTRYSDSDFARMQRQQDLLVALIDRVKERPDLLLHVASTASDCPGAITDLSATRLIAPAHAALSLTGDQITFRTIDQRMVRHHVTPGGAWVLLPQWEPIRALVLEMFPSHS